MNVVTQIIQSYSVSNNQSIKAVLAKHYIQRLLNCPRYMETGGRIEHGDTVCERD